MLTESELNGAVTLRGTDGGFTKASIESRIVKIFEKAKQWLIQNYPNHPDFDIEAITNLQDSLAQHELKIPIKTLLAYENTSDFLIDEEDNKIWAREQERHGITNSFQSVDWMEIRWIFMECMVYRLLVNYIKSPKNGIDPFGAVKFEAIKAATHNPMLLQLLNFFREDLTSSAISNFTSEEQKDLLRKMILTNLWGNKQDLSFSAGVVKKSSQNSFIFKEGSKTSKLLEMQDKLVINEIEDLLEFLMNMKNSQKTHKKVAFFVDNSGEEFYLDLFLGHLLINLNIFESVTYYVKKYPVFVSDVMIKEFHLHIEELKRIGKMEEETEEKSVKNTENTEKYDAEISDGQFFANSLEEHLKNQRIIVKASSFLCSGVTFFEGVPENFLKEIEEFDLIISKGDFMYRKFTGDLTHDPMQISFQEWMKKCNFPTNVACLRTNKSAAILGKLSMIPPDNTNSLNDDWRVNGEFGLISFYGKNL